MSEQDHFLVPPPAGQKRRRRRARPLSEQAQARLAAATSELPERGDRITIRWPGGPHDFVMVFEGEDEPAPPWPGWHFLYGSIVEPTHWHPKLWAPLVHLVDGEWAMLPKGGRIDVRDPALVEGDYESGIADER